MRAPSSFHFSEHTLYWQKDKASWTFSRILYSRWAASGHHWSCRQCIHSADSSRSHHLGIPHHNSSFWCHRAPRIQRSPCIPCLRGPCHPPRSCRWSLHCSLQPATMPRPRTPCHSSKSKTKYISFITGLVLRVSSTLTDQDQSATPAIAYPTNILELTSHQHVAV